jgi:hypothetical protein
MTADRDPPTAQEQVAEDLRRMTRLHELGRQLVGPGDVNAMRDNVIRASVDITDAEMGNIQLGDEAGALTIVAQVGFDRPFLGFFARVDVHTDSACAATMASRQRVLVEDVTTSPIFAGRASLPVLTAAGVRAVQSTIRSCGSVSARCLRWSAIWKCAERRTRPSQRGS